MVSVMLYPCMFCVALNGSVCFVCLTVFVNCLVKFELIRTIMMRFLKQSVFEYRQCGQ